MIISDEKCLELLVKSYSDRSLSGLQKVLLTPDRELTERVYNNSFKYNSADVEVYKIGKTFYCFHAYKSDRYGYQKNWQKRFRADFIPKGFKVKHIDCYVRDRLLHTFDSNEFKLNQNTFCQYLKYLMSSKKYWDKMANNPSDVNHTYFTKNATEKANLIESFKTMYKDFEEFTKRYAQLKIKNDRLDILDIIKAEKKYIDSVTVKTVAA